MFSISLSSSESKENDLLMVSVSNPEINFAMFSFVLKCKGVLMSELNVSVIKANSKLTIKKLKKTKNSSVNLVTY